MSAASGSTTGCGIDVKEASEAVERARRILNERKANMKNIRQSHEELQAERHGLMSDAQADNVLESLRRGRGIDVHAPVFDCMEVLYIEAKAMRPGQDERMASQKKSIERIEQHHAKLSAALSRFDDMLRSPSSLDEKSGRVLKEITDYIIGSDDANNKKSTSKVASSSS